MTNTAPATALDALLAEPMLGNLLAVAPTLAAAAAKARAERADIAKRLAAALANTATQCNAAQPSTDATGAAPIVRTNWTATIPTTDATFAIPSDMSATLAAALTARLPVILTGPAGTGKTEAVAWAAARASRPMFVVDAGAVRDSADWFGSPTMSAGRVAWQDSMLVSALATPNAVVLIDEINRSHSSAQAAWLPLLDRRGSIQFPARPEPVTVAEGVTVFATANVGHKHSGTAAITEALWSRFIVIPTDYLEPAAESALIRKRFPAVHQDIADALAGVAAFTRAPSWEQAGGKALSTREALTAAALAASLVQADQSPALALRALVARQPSDTFGGQASPAQSLAAYISRQFPTLSR